MTLNKPMEACGRAQGVRSMTARLPRLWGTLPWTARNLKILDLVVAGELPRLQIAAAVGISDRQLRRIIGHPEFRQAAVIRMYESGVALRWVRVQRLKGLAGRLEQMLDEIAQGVQPGQINLLGVVKAYMTVLEAFERETRAYQEEQAQGGWRARVPTRGRA